MRRTRDAGQREIVRAGGLGLIGDHSADVSKMILGGVKFGPRSDLQVSNATFVAYIDESGDEGFALSSGSSQWFVLAAAILKRTVDLQECKLVDAVRSGINAQRQPGREIPPKMPLHFRDLRHEQRRFYCEHIGRADLRTVCILVNKRDIASPENFTKESRLYFYTTRLLLERVSWYCRDHKTVHDLGDGSVDVVFSNRASMNYGSLKDYLRYLDANRAAIGYRAEPGIVRPDQVSSFTAGKGMGLQIADAVASSYYKAVEANAYGFTEESYARALLSRAYRHNKEVWGYGVKIMPRETEEKRRRGELLQGW